MLFILLLYRLGNAVLVPYVNTTLLGQYFDANQNSILGLWNVMSGSAFSRASIFALSIQPYINASIIIQLLTIAIPALERLHKEGGEEGKKKIEKITRYSTLAIGLIQGFSYYILIKNGFNGQSMLAANGAGFWPAIVIIASFTAGSCLLMWMGEQITEFGIGNGISVILFVSICSRFPNDLAQAISKVQSGQSHWWMQLLLLVGILLIIVMIVIVTQAERRNSGTVRQARCRSQDVRRPVDPPADEGQHVRRPADHLCPIDRVYAGHCCGLCAGLV